MPPSDSPFAEPTPWNAVADAYGRDKRELFEPFAAAALDLAGIRPADEVLDVACGPGTLTRLAAERAKTAIGVDFSEEMLRVARALSPAPRFLWADGQALPFADGSFDAAFSMFGLMYFPDRGRGFAELHRCLRPEGRAVIGSWAKATCSSLVEHVGAAAQAALPDRPAAKSQGYPLDEPADIEREMAAAGFVDIEVRTVGSEIVGDSAEAFWLSLIDSSALLLHLRDGYTEAERSDINARAIAELARRIEDWPHTFTITAYVAIARKRA